MNTYDCMHRCEEPQNHNIGGGEVKNMDRVWFHLYECQKQEKKVYITYWCIEYIYKSKIREWIT